jgi:hypothetical protein
MNDLAGFIVLVAARTLSYLIGDLFRSSPKLQHALP